MEPKEIIALIKLHLVELTEKTGERTSDKVFQKRLEQAGRVKKYADMLVSHYQKKFAEEDQLKLM
jgi:hypothetical protein